MPMLFRNIQLSLASVAPMQIVGGKKDGTTGVLLQFDDFLVSSIFLERDDAVKLRDALIAMSEQPVADDDGESWKQGKKEEESE